MGVCHVGQLAFLGVREGVAILQVNSNGARIVECTVAVCEGSADLDAFLRGQGTSGATGQSGACGAGCGGGGLGGVLPLVGNSIFHINKIEEAGAKFDRV